MFLTVTFSRVLFFFRFSHVLLCLLPSRKPICRKLNFFGKSNLSDRKTSKNKSKLTVALFNGAVRFTANGSSCRCCTAFATDGDRRQLTATDGFDVRGAQCVVNDPTVALRVLCVRAPHGTAAGWLRVYYYALVARSVASKAGSERPTNCPTSRVLHAFGSNRRRLNSINTTLSSIS